MRFDPIARRLRPGRVRGVFGRRAGRASGAGGQGRGIGRQHPCRHGRDRRPEHAAGNPRNRNRRHRAQARGDPCRTFRSRPPPSPATSIEQARPHLGPRRRRAHARASTSTATAVGRAFVSIRGVGITLVQTVQPGVGIFIDGIYQPNTAYPEQPAGRRRADRGAARAAGHALRQEHARRRDQRHHPPARQRARGARSSRSYAGARRRLDASRRRSAARSSRTCCRSASPPRTASRTASSRNTLLGGRRQPAQHRLDQRHDPGRAGRRRRRSRVNGYYDWSTAATRPTPASPARQDYIARASSSTRATGTTVEYHGVNGKLEFPIDGIDDRRHADRRL